jgi:arylsulfatase A-like enzyme
LQDGGIKRDLLAWYYPHYSPQAKWPGYAIRKGDFKLIEHYDPVQVELFNLRKDIGENDDLSASMPDKVREMQDSFSLWLEKMNPVLHTPNPNHQ